MADLISPQAAGSVRGCYIAFCHQIPERSLSINGNYFAFCARCTGLYGGLFLSVLVVNILRLCRPLSLQWSVLLTIPGVADGLFDFGAHLPAANLWRLLTGLGAGIGIAWFIYPRVMKAMLR